MSQEAYTSPESTGEVVQAESTTQQGQALLADQASEPVGQVHNTDDFINSLSEEHKPTVTKKGFKSVDDVLKAYENLESKLGKRFDDLTADEIKALNVKLGAPESPDGYELSLPEGFQDDGSLNAFAHKAHELGLPKDKAEALYGWYMETQIDGLKMAQANAQNDAVEKVESLKKEFGAAFDERISLAKHALKEFGGDEVLDIINKYGLGNEPALVKMFAEIGKLTSEDKIVGEKSSASFGVTPAEADAKIASLYKDKEFMARWSNPTAQGHDEAVKQLETLYKLRRGVK